MKYQKILEGRTTLVVPSGPQPADGKSRIFFNPVAALNRDVSVAIAGAAGVESFCDSMCGVGARGVRIANEVASVREVTLVDLNGRALRLARRSAALNGVLRKCEFLNGDANSTLFGEFQGERRTDMVDLDPFGTPIRQLQGAISATVDGGMFSMTATDTAVLCGVHQRVCKRRYGSAPLNNSFHHETAIRILVNAARRIASSLDLGISPVAAHSTRHYIRVYAQIRVGASKADEDLQREGFLLYCTSCGHTESSLIPAYICHNCGKKNRVAGPLWTGNLCDRGVVALARKRAVTQGLADAAKLLQSLEPVDSFPPWSFAIEEACSTLKVKSVAEKLVVENLSKNGFKAARQPFETTGLKTDASHSEFLDAVRAAARGA
jgi:tRNA (guanine26-N2/guanine27-N2)-dimethyltransferase